MTRIHLLRLGIFTPICVCVAFSLLLCDMRTYRDFENVVYFEKDKNTARCTKIHTRLMVFFYWAERAMKFQNFPADGTPSSGGRSVIWRYRSTAAYVRTSPLSLRWQTYWQCVFVFQSIHIIFIPQSARLCYSNRLAVSLVFSRCVGSIYCICWKIFDMADFVQYWLIDCR